MRALVSLVVVSVVVAAACSAAPPPPTNRVETCPATPSSAALPSASASTSASAPAASVSTVLAFPYDLPKLGEVAPPPAPELPGFSTGEPVARVFTVTLTRTGEHLVDGQRIGSLDELLSHARRAHARDPDVRAVIQADGAVPWARVIAVVDRLKQAGIARLAFGVSPVPPPPPPTAQLPPPPPGRRMSSSMPEDCFDICSLGVGCKLGHVKTRDACDAWCERSHDMETYACIALHGDCDAMNACFKRAHAPGGTRQKGQEGTMGRSVPPK